MEDYQKQLKREEELSILLDELTSSVQKKNTDITQSRKKELFSWIESFRPIDRNLLDRVAEMAYNLGQYSKAFSHCQDHCPDFQDCCHEGAGFCDSQKRKFGLPDDNFSTKQLKILEARYSTMLANKHDE